MTKGGRRVQVAHPLARRHGRRPAVVAAWTLFVCASLLYAFYLGVHVFAPPQRRYDSAVFNPSQIAWTLTYVGMTAVGAVITIRRTRHPIGWLFLIAGSLYAVASGAATYGAISLSRGGALPLTHFAGWLVVWMWTLPIALIVVALLYFPDGALPSPRWRVVLVPTAVVGVAIPMVNAATLWTVRTDWLVTGDETKFSHLAQAKVSLALTRYAYPVVLLGALLSMLSLVLRFRRSRDIERQQLKWLLPVALLSGAALVLSEIPAVNNSGWSDVVNVVNVPFGFPLAVGLAITRYRLYDIDRIVSRTVSYAVVTGLLVGVYLAGVGLATRLLPLSSGIGVAGATLAAAALFQPLRRRVQHAVDRRFNRARYDAARIVDGFASQLRDEVDLDSVRTELLRIVARTVQPAESSVWLREGAA